MKTPAFESAKIAVIIHAFHMDVFREIIETLGDNDSRLRIFVTTTQEREAEAKEVLAKTPFEATVHVYDNHGRDVLPFLSLLKDIDLDPYAFILKLHTKKSLHRQDGEHWRQQAVSCLATFDQREWILQQMCEAPDIGMVGPRDHVVPMHFYHGSNIENMKWIAARLGFETLSLEKDSFIAGTMFMARTEALIPILNIALDAPDFEPEAGQLDGTMAHAIERAFTYSAAAAGMGIASIGPGDAAKHVSISTVANQEFAFAARS
jgi:lipopolysaccharide biosynthesis protein